MAKSVEMDMAMALEVGSELWAALGPERAKDVYIPPKGASLCKSLCGKLAMAGLIERTGSLEEKILASRTALCNLGQYTLAAALLKVALAELGSSKLRSCYGATLKLMVQSTLGRYELKDYYTSGFKEGSAPELAEYVHKGVVVSASSGKGRGVFLTEPVSKGDILIVSNAIGLRTGRQSDSMKNKHELFKSIMKTCKGSVVKLAQVLSLRDARTSSLDHPYGSVPTEPVPSMALFRPNNWPALAEAIRSMIQSFHGQQMDIEAEVSGRIQLENSVTDEMEPLVGKPFCGMWVLPSLINHSCMGNVSLHRVGKALLVIASRDMKAGTELERSYGGPYAPFFLRWAWSGENGFVCKCARCVFESSLKPGETKLNNFTIGFGVTPTVVEKEIAKLKIKGITQEQEDYLRVSYALEYVKEVEMKRLPGDFAEAMMRALHSTVPGYSCNLQLMAYMNKLAGTGSAQALLEEECVARVGRLDRQVLHAVIDHALSKPLS